MKTSGNEFYNICNVSCASVSYSPCISPSPCVPNALRCVKFNSRSFFVTNIRNAYLYYCFFSPRIYYLSEHNSNFSLAIFGLFSGTFEFLRSIEESVRPTHVSVDY